MSINVTYGNYSFPEPKPFAAFNDTPVYTSGKYDHYSKSITLVGTLTGDGLAALKAAKNSLVLALSTGFQTLTVGTGSWSYAKPVSISFDQSNLLNFQPYSIEFAAYPASGGSFFGLLNPVDTWSFQEQEGRIVSAVHTCSVSASKVSAGDPLVAARNFVTSRMGGFENASTFLSGQGFLVAKSESIDRLTSSYSLSETWNYSTAKGEVTGVICRPQVQISYDRSLNVRVNGSIYGGLTGFGYAPVTTGDFTINHAKEAALNALERHKSSYESGIYGSVLNNPLSSSYSFQDGKNEMSFSFEFGDPSVPNSGIDHRYTTAISASKDSSNVVVSVNGEIRNIDPFSFFNTGAPETGARWTVVDSYFSGVNPYALAYKSYEDFNSGVSFYDFSTGLNPTAKSESVQKDPYNASISYSYSYDNSVDWSSGYLAEASATVEKTYSITQIIADETVGGGWNRQTGFSTLPQTSVSLNGSITGSMAPPLAFASGYADTLLGLFGFTGTSIVTSHSVETGSNSLSVSKTAIFTV